MKDVRKIDFLVPLYRDFYRKPGPKMPVVKPQWRPKQRKILCGLVGTFSCGQYKMLCGLCSHGL